jgi:hypothetical protein
MLGSMKDYVREALITTALFGGIGVASAQAQAPTPAPQSDTDQSVQPTAIPAMPAKFSPQNDTRDEIPVMVRAPALSVAQRKLIVDRVMSRPASAGVDASPAMDLAFAAELQPFDLQPIDLQPPSSSMGGEIER